MSVAVFTDPDCPYCKKYHQELSKIANITVYYFLTPLAKLHPQANIKSVAIWCAGDNTQRSKALALTMSSGWAERKTCPNPINDNIKVLNDKKFQGVPTTIFENGNIVEGGMDYIYFMKKLAENSSAKK